MSAYQVWAWATSASTGSRAITSAIERDRKSTRLNSNHGYISYAVFCLKKKKKKNQYNKGFHKLEKVSIINLTTVNTLHNRLNQIDNSFLVASYYTIIASHCHSISPSAT